MRVSVESEGCISCGMCEQTAPEIFTLKNGVAEVLSPQVAPHCEAAAKQAAAQCPVNVIYIDG